MLPFLKDKDSAATVPMIKLQPDEGEGDASGMEMAAQDLLNAIQAGDAKGVASALQAAFEIAGSEPQEPSMDEHMEGSQE